ncbi:hypothetical protein [Lentzea sp. NPDC051838]|uniref:hypothetical protein n=1 Tax=Lentzea sp. NPDC051838 TaxID=3154849 RepID=UPI003414F427
MVTAKPAQIREIHPEGGILFSPRNCPPAWTRSYLVRARSRTESPPLKDGGERLGFWVIDPYGSYTGSPRCTSSTPATSGSA